jgi:hypothetical protein
MSTAESPEKPAESEKPDTRTVVPVPANPSSAPGYGVPDPVQEALEKARQEQREKAQQEAPAPAPSSGVDAPTP